MSVSPGVLECSVPAKAEGDKRPFALPSEEPGHHLPGSHLQNGWRAQCIVSSSSSQCFREVWQEAARGSQSALGTSLSVPLLSTSALQESHALSWHSRPFPGQPYLCPSPALSLLLHHPLHDVPCSITLTHPPAPFAQVLSLHHLCILVSHPPSQGSVQHSCLGNLARPCLKIKSKERTRDVGRALG